jgi:hypothetical protein
MPEMNMLSILMGIIGTLVGLLTVVIGWIGTRIHSRLDSISTSLSGIEKDLRKDLSSLDRRLVAVETRHDMETGKLRAMDNQC